MTYDLTHRADLVHHEFAGGDAGPLRVRRYEKAELPEVFLVAQPQYRSAGQDASVEARQQQKRVLGISATAGDLEV